MIQNIPDDCFLCNEEFSNPNTPNPITSHCGHTYCQLCWNRWIERKGVPTPCPMCNAELTFEDHSNIRGRGWTVVAHMQWVARLVVELVLLIIIVMPVVFVAVVIPCSFTNFVANEAANFFYFVMDKMGGPIIIRPSQN